MTALRKPIDWRQCDFISLTNAGRVAGKSAAWARGAVCTGDLQAVRLPNGGAEVITVKSLADFLERVCPIGPDDLRRTGPLSHAVH
ncbi:MAG: hypothetical protein V4551_11040 [Pseudomonadota bacterium]